MRGYFDHNATSPIRPEIVAVMAEVMAGEAGNPSSMHAEGRLARELLDQARSRLAGLLDCEPGQVLFTSGATESNNLAIRGMFAADPGLRVITCAAEHVSVLGTVEALGSEGADTVMLAVDGSARPNLEELTRLGAKGPTLMALGWANSESGHLADIDGLLAVKGPGCRLHLDAAQAVGRVPVAMREGMDSLALSAHKFGGPRGIGALVLADHSAVEGLMSGGPQEAGLRPGTENLAGIVGMGLAAKLAGKQLGDEQERLGRLRETLWDRLTDALDGLIRVSAKDGLPGTLTVALPGVRAEVLVAALDMEGFAVSTGSACAAASPEPSHVMEALGLPLSHRNGVIRISMGWNTSAEQTEGLAEAFVHISQRARRAA